MANELILIPDDVAAAGKEFLLSKGYRIKVLTDHSLENMCLEIPEASAVLARLGKYPAELIEAGKNLKIFAKHGAGYDDVDLEALKKAGVILSNTPEANANSVAEHTIGMMFACAQNLVSQDHRTRNGQFASARKEPTMELAGKTLGLIGFGRIAREVAKKAALGLGMKVLVWNRSGLAGCQDEAAKACVTAVSTLKELYLQSDVISPHIPHNPSTHHMIDEEALSLLKPTAILLNFARGGIIDEAALFTALQEHKIAMAGLDCHETEPCVPSNPLFALDNVIVLPHAGGQSKEGADAMSLHAAWCIHDVLGHGRKPRFPVYVPEECGLKEYCEDKD